jgi:hypothetical protein
MACIEALRYRYQSNLAQPFVSSHQAIQVAGGMSSVYWNHVCCGLNLALTEVEVA